MRSKVSDATKDEVRFLNSQGLSKKEIGQRVGLHPSIIGNLLWRQKGCPAKTPKPDRQRLDVSLVNQVLMQPWNKAINIEAVSIGQSALL